MLCGPPFDITFSMRSMNDERNTTTVGYSKHIVQIDLSGRDLISVLGKSRAEVAAMTGLNFSAQTMTPKSVPAAKVTSMAGEVADEVHDWPNASQGLSFHSMSLHFRDGVLITLEWNFTLEDFLVKKKPWYRRWF